MDVRPFKKGPDYIDPMWLGMAAGRACYNLDFHTMEADEIVARFRQHADGGDVSIIEGNKGLYDGLDLDGSNSNAALARLLNTPVILVLDARGMTRGIAPLVLGYQDFDPEISIRGVILNQVGGSRHESKLRSILEHYTDVMVLGAVHKNPELNIDERHLGLVPSNESGQARDKIERIAHTLSNEVDLDMLIKLAHESASLPDVTPITDIPPRGHRLRIGIAHDSAFGFYYPDDLEALTAAGAELVFFSPLTDDRIPDVDALFLGGGFPETHMESLAANTGMLTSVRKAITSGLPAYAECGGLMYLARSLQWHTSKVRLANVIPGDIIMHDKPQGRGYIHLLETSAMPWPDTPPANREIHAHEFHYSSIENLPSDTTYAYTVRRGHGINGTHDGIVCHNLLANYAHMRHTRSNQWAFRFVKFIRDIQAGQNDSTASKDN